MKKIRVIFLLSLSLLAFPFTLSAQGVKSRDLALGITVGSPFGVTGKYWINPYHALSAGMGYPLGSKGDFSINGSYMVQMPLNTNFPGQIPFYVGGGMRIRALGNDQLGDDADVGLQFPLGFDFLPTRSSFNFFVQLVPVLVFAPQSNFSLDGSMGIRYKFSIR